MSMYKQESTGFSPFLRGLGRTRADVKETYEVAGDDVTLEIQVVDGHLARHSISVDGQSFGRSGDKATLELGPGPKLKGTQLTITSVIPVEGSARVQALYRLTGGSSPRDLVVDRPLEESDTNFLVNVAVFFI